MLTGVTKYAYAAIVTIVLGGWVYYDGVVNSLEKQVLTLERKVAVMSANSVTLKATIKDNNDRIAKQKIELDIRITELGEWKNKPEKVRYETIYKHVPEWVDVRREDCETTKSVIDAARNTDFNRL